MMRGKEQIYIQITKVFSKYKTVPTVVCTYKFSRVFLFSDVIVYLSHSITFLGFILSKFKSKRFPFQKNAYVYKYLLCSKSRVKDIRCYPIVKICTSFYFFPGNRDNKIFSQIAWLFIEFRLSESTRDGNNVTSRL